MHIKTKNLWINITSDRQVGFGYSKIKGNNHKRSLYFVGFFTVEVMDKRIYSNIERGLFFWEPFSKDKYNGKWTEL